MTGLPFPSVHAFSVSHDPGEGFGNADSIGSLRSHRKSVNNTKYYLESKRN